MDICVPVVLLTRLLENLLSLFLLGMTPLQHPANSWAGSKTELAQQTPLSILDSIEARATSNHLKCLPDNRFYE